MLGNLENLAVAKGLQRSVFIPVPKKGNAKEWSNYCIMAHISHASKVMLKIFQARLQEYVNHELPDVQAGFRKGREPEIKLPASLIALEKVSFHSNPKERQCQRMLKLPHNCTHLTR